MTPLFRHPTSLGGFWTINLFALPVSQLFIFYTYEPQEVLGGAWEKLPTYLMYATAVQIVLWMVFFRIGNPATKPSFYCFTTGKDFELSKYRLGSDATKLNMLTSLNKNYFMEAKDEVVDWIQDSWELWIAEETFSLERIAAIPEDFIPVELHSHLAGFLDENEKKQGDGIMALLNKTTPKSSGRHARIGPGDRSVRETSTRETSGRRSSGHEKSQRKSKIAGGEKDKISATLVGLSLTKGSRSRSFREGEDESSSGQDKSGSDSGAFKSPLLIVGSGRGLVNNTGQH
jgi:hypothetical protein